MDYNFLIGAFIPVSVALISVIIPFLKTLLDNKKENIENKEITEDIQKTINDILNLKKEKQDDDIIALMIKNVGELREYYTINKQQARNSFSAALFISILGFILFSTGIILTYMYKSELAIQYTTIAGAIVELIAGLFFWLYSKAIKQINLFHSSLLNTEKFLTAIQLIEKLSPENRDKAYNVIIEKVVNQNLTNK